MKTREEVIAVFKTKERETKDHWEKECEWRKIEHLAILDRKETPSGPILIKAYPKSFAKIICGNKMQASLFEEIAKTASAKGIFVEWEQTINFGDLS